MVYPDTAVISCVVSTYMPLDEKLLGLNPIRLPVDGKVPIFSDGRIILVHRKIQKNEATLTANQTINMNAVNLSAVEIYDSSELYVPELNNYTYDKATGIVTILETANLTGYTAPYAIVARVEDMLLASDVQVTGHITVTSKITHDYPANETLVSSVLPCGDLQSRAYNVFSQQTWSGKWSNLLIGNGILAKYNNVDYPILVKNRDATQERWAIIFLTSTTVQIIGERTGVVASGVNIFANAYLDVPNSEYPYFRIYKNGFGADGGGWAAGNVLRFNTDAANYPIWAARCTLQGPVTEATDNYVMAIRGDAS